MIQIYKTAKNCLIFMNMTRREIELLFQGENHFKTLKKCQGWCQSVIAIGTVES